jgi:hypothetical protein
MTEKIGMLLYYKTGKTAIRILAKIICILYHWE